MVRTFGSSETGKQERQQKILRLYVRGMTPAEIAALLNVKPRTIYRDLEELAHWLRQQNDRRKIYSLGEAFALAKEILREAWILYHRSPPKDEDGVARDDTIRKLYALDRVMKAEQTLERLAGFQTSDTIPTEPTTEPMSSEEQLAALVEILPLNLRNEIIEHLQHKMEREETS